MIKRIDKCNIDVSDKIQFGSNIFKRNNTKIATKSILDVIILCTLLCIGCDNSSSEPNTEPLEISLSVSHVSVYGGSDGSIELSVTGGTEPYQYQWSNGKSTEDINNLTAGEYSVIVIDANDTNTTNSCSINQPSESSGDEGFENGILTDIDGNTYSTIQIGNQIWTADNWKCLHKTNSTSLNGVHSYDNNDSYLIEYGMLYTWQSARDASPSGWHLPTENEWQILINTVGSNPVDKLRNGGSSGLNLKMGGRRTGDGDYGYIGSLGVYWTSFQSDGTHAVVKMIATGETNVITDNTRKDGEVSVRYIKDNS